MTNSQKRDRFLLTYSILFTNGWHFDLPCWLFLFSISINLIKINKTPQRDKNHPHQSLGPSDLPLDPYFSLGLDTTCCFNSLFSPLGLSSPLLSSFYHYNLTYPLPLLRRGRFFITDWLDIRGRFCIMFLFP